MFIKPLLSEKYTGVGASEMVQTVKNLPAMQEPQETQVQSLDRKIPWRRAWQPSPVFLSREFHGQRSLAGFSPWGFKESLHGVAK